MHYPQWSLKTNGHDASWSQHYQWLSFLRQTDAQPPQAKNHGSLHGHSKKIRLSQLFNKRACGHIFHHFSCFRHSTMQELISTKTCLLIRNLDCLRCYQECLHQPLQWIHKKYYCVFHKQEISPIRSRQILCNRKNR